MTDFHAVQDYLRTLQDRICAGLEAIDGGRFFEKARVGGCVAHADDDCAVPMADWQPPDSVPPDIAEALQDFHQCLARMQAIR